jgi:hypothetical protein
MVRDRLQQAALNGPTVRQNHLDKRVITSLIAQWIATGFGHENHVGAGGEELLWVDDHTVLSHDNLAHCKAASETHCNLLEVPNDTRIASGGGRVRQTVCTDGLCHDIAASRHKLLVEMAG